MPVLVFLLQKIFKNNNFGFHVHFQPCCFWRDQYVPLNCFNTQSYELISLA